MKIGSFGVSLSLARQIVVIGAGQAAAQVLQSLRQGGYAGELTLIGEEPHLPYQRPPLSKAYMKGEFEAERLYFRAADWYDDANIFCHLNTHARHIDRAAQTVQTDAGALPYDALVLATGSRPRPLPLPGAELNGVFDVRSLGDVDAIRPLMQAGKRLVIIGAGYIGLEAAAAARQLGLDVTVLEMAPRVLARVTGPELSAFYAAEHRRQGVKLMTDVRLTAIEGEEGKACSVRLADGTALAADLVLVGIGILPNQELAADAGLACASGILTDRDGRTSDPRIFAAGDCASRPLVHYGRQGRLESVHNAIEQGKLVAAAILGAPRPVEDCPWFWSDQYDLKLQIAGLSDGYDRTVVRGDPTARSFAVFYLRNGTLIAADAVNAAPEFIVAKKLISAGTKLAPERLGDTSVSMKDIAALPAA
jgi:3-phenylpropionate/trans-cinnamate dioxygenase ferredoxin reductase component